VVVVAAVATAPPHPSKLVFASVGLLVAIYPDRFVVWDLVRGVVSIEVSTRLLGPS